MNSGVCGPAAGQTVADSGAAVFSAVRGPSGRFRGDTSPSGPVSGPAASSPSH